MKYKISLLLVLSIIFTFSSCMNEDDYNFDKLADVSGSANVSISAIHSKLSMYDVLRDYDSSHLFVIDEQTKFLSLVYRGEVFSKTAEQEFIIPNQLLTNAIPVTIPGSNQIGNVYINSFPLIEFNFTTNNNEKIDTLYLKGGQLKINLDNSTIPYPSKIYIEIPELQNNLGQTYKDTIDYSYPKSFVKSGSSTQELNGYKIVFDHFPTNNGISVKISATINKTSVNTSTLNCNLNLNLNFENLKFRKLVGFLGTKTFDIEKDTVLMDVFKNVILGKFFVEDPRLNFYAYNSFGVPIIINFEQMKSYSSTNLPHEVNLTGNGSAILPPWVINSPTLAEVGKTKETIRKFNKESCNIKDALNISPYYLMYKISGSGNPVTLPTSKNFVLDTSKFKFDVEVDMPMYGRLSGMIMQDTIDFTFKEVKEIEWVKIRTNVKNGFPMEAYIQVYFVDSLYKRVDSLFVKKDVNDVNYNLTIMPGITSGPLMKVDQVTGVRTKIRDAVIDKNRIANLKDVKKILVKGVMNTSNNSNVNESIKIYADYILDVRMGVQVQLKANSGDYK